MKLDEQLAALPGADTDSIQPENMAGFLANLLGQGDTVVDPTESSEPAAASKPLEVPAAPAPAPTEPAAVDPATAAPAPAAAPEPTPVVLARDGVHTISYDRLVEARQQAAEAKALAEQRDREIAELTAKLAAATSPNPDPATHRTGDAGAGESGTSDDDRPFGDYTDEGLTRGVDRRVEAVVKPLQDQIKALVAEKAEAEARTAYESHVGAILAVHPDAESIVASQEFADWKASLPSVFRAGVEAVQHNSTPEQMVEVLNSYRAARPRTAPAAQPATPARATGAPDAAALAAQAIAEAKVKTPASLSDLPAGTQAHHDPADAINAMSSAAMLANFSAMTPEQIEQQMRRLT
jgi:hypothetical protein